MARTQINGKFITDSTIVPSADIIAGSPAQILICDTLGKLQFVSMTGDATISPNGIITASQSQFISSGFFTNYGDARSGSYTLRNITTDGVLTEVFTDGVSAQMVLPNLSTWTYNAQIVGRRTDTNSVVGGWTIQGLISRDIAAPSTALIGTRSKTVLTKSNIGWDVEVFADSVTGALTFKVMGSIGSTIRWVATVQTTEVTN